MVLFLLYIGFKGDVYMWIKYNPSPKGARVGDCAIRAVSKALDISWEQAYARIVAKGFDMCDMPSSNAVWGAVLHDNGFVRETIPNTCPDCYSLIDFCRDNPRGLFVVGMSGHVVTVVNGDYYDSWDSGHEIPIYYWRR
jgi:hypothetical protein